MSDDFEIYKNEAVKILKGLEKYDDDVLIKIVGFALIVAIDNIYQDFAKASNILNGLHEASQRYLVKRRPECHVGKVDVESDDDGKIDIVQVSAPTSIDGKPMSAEDASALHQKLMVGKFPLKFSRQAKLMMDKIGISEEEVKDLMAKALRKTMS